MTGLSQEEILQSTRTVLQGLEALKDEHESIKVNIDILKITVKMILTSDYHPCLTVVFISGYISEYYSRIECR